MPVVDAQDLSVLHRAGDAASACRPRTAGCRTTRRSSRPCSATSAALGHELPRRPRDRGPRRRVLERRHRQGRRLQHGGAAAGQDRRLRSGPRRSTSRRSTRSCKDKGIEIRLDSFIDPGLIRRVAGVVRELYAEKGYQFAEVKPEIKAVDGGPKLVNVTFHITEGPKVKIREVEFLGNQEISDGKLREADEGEQGRSGCSRLHHRRRHLQGRQVRGGRRARHRATTANGATSRRRSGSRS